MARRKFFTTVLMSFFWVSLVPIVLLGYVAMSISSRSAINDIKKQVSMTSSSALDSVSSMLSSFEESLLLFSEDPEVRQLMVDKAGPDMQKVYRKMYLLLSGHADTCAMHLVSKDGQLQMSTGILPVQYDPASFSEWGLLRLLGETDNVVAYANKLSEKDTLSIGRAVRDIDGNLEGYAIVDVPAESLENRLRSVSSSLPFVFSLADRHGFFLFDQTGCESQVNIASLPEVTEMKISQNRMFVSATALEKGDLVLFTAVPVDLVIESNRTVMGITLVFAAISIALSILCSIGLARNVSRPVVDMRGMMEKVEQGDFSARCTEGRPDELGDLASQLNRMVIHLDVLFKENLEKQDRLRTAELKNLKAQIDPHFLYNTLDCIRYMVKLGMQKEAAMAISDLSVLLKNSIGNSKDMNTVSESMHVIESYLEIVHLEHPDKFSTDIDIEPAIEGEMIPKLLLQPVVENAVVHGLEEKIGKGKLEIRGKKEGETICFIVRDDGVGMDGRTLASALQGNADSIALYNIKQRLQLYYGDNASFTIKSVLHQGTEVRMVIPLKVVK
jgi:two-component system sensor histidine kinase YesM